MKVEAHLLNNIKIAELIADGTIVRIAQDGLDILGNLMYEGFDGIIMHQKNISSDFFDLKTGIAGEILQKFSTYRVRLAIVGDFSNFTSKSIRDFIYESNKVGHICFVGTLSEAIDKLSGK